MVPSSALGRRVHRRTSGRRSRPVTNGPAGQPFELQEPYERMAMTVDSC